MEEKSLSLVVKEKTLGSLVTNAKDIKKFVEEKLKTYSVENYAGDDKQAAKDKAELNNAAKQLNDQRITLEKEWLKPFTEFKDVVNETVNLIKDASSKLDVIVKAKEQEQKEAKRNIINVMWQKENFNLVSLDRVFKTSWLNKTTKPTTIELEIKNIIETIQNDLNALESFGDDTAHLKELYLSNLNLQITLQKGAELKANRQKLEEMKKAQEEAAKKQEEQNTIQDEKVNVDTPEETTVEIPIENKVPIENTECSKPVEQPVERKEYTFNVIGSAVKDVSYIVDRLGLEKIESLTVRATAKEIDLFKSYLKEHNLSYVKEQFLTLAINK